MTDKDFIFAGYTQSKWKFKRDKFSSIELTALNALGVLLYTPDMSQQANHVFKNGQVCIDRDLLYPGVYWKGIWRADQSITVEEFITDAVQHYLGGYKPPEEPGYRTPAPIDLDTEANIKAKQELLYTATKNL